MLVIPRRWALGPALFLLATAAACARGDSLPGAPQPLTDMLEIMPAEAVSRGLYYTDLTSLADPQAEGFATVLPLGAQATAGLGFSIENALQILETGDPASALLRGTWDAEAITQGFESMGYSRDDAGGWLVFRRSGELPPDAPPATVAIPAAALRGGLLFLGSTHELPAVTGEAVTAMDFEWMARVVRAVGPDAAAIALGAPPASFRVEAERAGTDVAGLLSQAGMTSPLPEYQGFAVAFSPSDDAATNGVVALAYAPEAEGKDPALNLAVRINTAHLLGGASSIQGRDALEGGAPRWIEGERVVFVPVAWNPFDGTALRDDLRRGKLLFLAPLSEAAPG
ncbi:MAG TPA: hypothetical protein VML96_01520 [Egibacteraceae bacterium]|nr:hypothetical protein [Egibacteraceae bacterium]